MPRSNALMGAAGSSRFSLLERAAQDTFGAFRQNAKRDRHGLAQDEALVTDFDADRVEQDQGLAGVERAPLRFGRPL